MMIMGEMIFLADAFTERVNAANQGGRFDSKDLLLVYLRSRKKSDDANQERLAQITQSQSNETGSERGERRRKRRRRRDHRPRNPSLDKTGGLPPPRPDDQLPKF